MPTPRPQLTLREWDPAETELSPDDALALREAPADVAVETLGAGRYRVTPSHFVGSLPLPGLDVVIRPKVAVSRLFFLLGYSRRLRFRDEAMRLAESSDLTEAIIQAFLGQVRATLRKGPLMSYRGVEDSLPTIRGRVRLLDQARRRFTMPLPVEVSYDDFTVDIEENRLLKAALARAGRLRLRDARAKRRISEMLGALVDVADVRYDARTLPGITITRLNQHYEQSLGLAKLVLASSTTDLAHSDVPVPSFLIDMDKVFEDFVFSAIGDELKLAGAKWSQGKRMTFDVAGRIRIKPDLSLWRQGVCCFVGDVKYKVTELGEHQDLYQVLSYAHAAGLPEALLIYASAGKTADKHVVRNDGTMLHVRYVDLEATDAEIRQAMADLAGLITEMAASAELAVA